MGPGKRCLAFMVQMVTTVDRANKAAMVQQRDEQRVVSKEKEEQYADL